jgi:hypothetical protein
MMRSRLGSRLVFMFVFLLIYTFVRGAVGDPAGLFIGPLVAGIATIAISYWIRARLNRS